MIKKLLTGITILLIALQIPVIIVLSGAQIVSKNLEEAETNIRQTKEMVEELAQPVAAAAGTLMGDLKEKVGPAVSKVAQNLKEEVTEGTETVFAEGQQNVQEIQDMLAKGTKGMWISIIITLLLIFLLAILNWNWFLNNLGLALLIGGIASLITGGLIYYFFVANFDTTFDQLYAIATSEMADLLDLPFVASLIKSFAEDFIVSVANQLVGRSAMAGGISIVIGFILRILQRLVVRR